MVIRESPWSGIVFTEKQRRHHVFPIVSHTTTTTTGGGGIGVGVSSDSGVGDSTASTGSENIRYSFRVMISLSTSIRTSCKTNSSISTMCTQHTLVTLTFQ